MERLIAEIMNEVWREEQKANKEQYVGSAKEIRIHPNQFNELMDADEFQQYTYCNMVTGAYSLCGIPLYRDRSIESWKIII